MVRTAIGDPWSSFVLLVQFLTVLPFKINMTFFFFRVGFVNPQSGVVTKFDIHPVECARIKIIESSDLKL